MTPFTSQRWPTADERLLLRAALADGPQAIEAWQAWKSRVPFESIDGAAFELAPMVARNLSTAGYQDGITARLSGIARRTWFRNQTMIHTASSAVRVLQAEGLPVLLLKGVPLLERYYGDRSLRPMADVDILVPERDAARAAALLRAGGWRPLIRPHERLEDVMRVLHAVGMECDGASVDLHWHVLEESCGDGSDDDFWTAARELEVGGVRASMLSAADLLLHICVHGSRGYPSRTLRWIPDALLIIADEPDLDWDRVVRQARARRLSLAMGSALEYLRTTFGAGVPAHAIDRLARTKPGLVERLDYRAQGSADTVYWSIVRDCARYLRLSAGRPIHRRALGFPAYLRHLWGLESLSAVPLEGSRRVGRRLWETRFRLRQPIARR